MRTLLRSVLAALVVALILSGAETVAGYPRPSSASGAFFFFSFVTYLPLLIIMAWGFSVLMPKRGLDLWFPLLMGALRLASPVFTAARAGEGTLLALIILSLVVIEVIRGRTESATQSPPFLFGLTVGIVLPILMARVAAGNFADRSGNAERALAFGALAGLLAFVLLRAFVARWPQVAPVFLLGPVVGLFLWNRPASSPGPREASRSPPFASSRPDIVLIVLDTVRAQALASYGHSRDTMPNLEAFARSSTLFTRAWTNGSWTLPGHASLFSGLRLTRHHYDSGFGAEVRASPDLFLAARLGRAGYATGAAVANFGVFGREDPLQGGFSSLEAEPLRPFAFKPWFFDLLAWFPRSAWLRGGVARFPAPSMRAPWVVDRALEFWSRAEGRPRFLFVNLMEAHLPWIPEAGDLGRFGPAGLDLEGDQLSVLGRYLTDGRPTAAEVVTLRDRYDEALYSLDRNLARLLNELTGSPSKSGLIVVVTSDHGESLGEHDRFVHRNSLDEVATRIPMIVRGPGLDAGLRRDTPVQLVDIFGYLARSAGIDVEPGLDARPFGERRLVVVEHRPGTQGTLPSSYPRGDLSALIDWPYKYVEGPGFGPSLFDLSADPGELKNLAAHEPARAEAMRLLVRDLSGAPSSSPSTPDRAAEERLRALGYVR